MKKIDQQILLTVITALHWSEQQYTQFIYDCGLAYLNAFIKDYPAVKTQISKSEIFWDWWKTHWEQREKEFIETIETYPESITDIHQQYKAIHDPVELATGIYLNGKVLEESYVNMINDITKNQKKFVYA